MREINGLRGFRSGFTAETQRRGDAIRGRAGLSQPPNVAIGTSRPTSDPIQFSKINRVRLASAPPAGTVRNPPVINCWEVLLSSLLDSRVPHAGRASSRPLNIRATRSMLAQALLNSSALSGTKGFWAKGEDFLNRGMLVAGNKSATVAG